MDDLKVSLQPIPQNELMQDFKMTELGPLPEDWQVIQLEKIADVKGGKRLPKGHRFSNSPSRYPYIRVVDFQSHTVSANDLRFLTAEDRAAIKRYTISSRDVYISIAGTIGLVGTVPSELDGANLTENAAKIVIEDNAQLDQHFLVYFLSSDKGRAEISLRTTKTSQPKLALTRIKQIPLPLPSLPEQRAIAHVLRTVQEAKEVTENVIEATRELKRSLMRHFFTYGPVPVGEAERVPLRETEIGPVPEHWLSVKLGGVARIVSGGTPSRKSPEFWNGEIPWVKTGEIRYNTITTTEERISERGLMESSARLLPAGTLLMAMYGQGVTRGRVATLGIDAAINQACAAILPSREIEPGFLYHFFSYTYENIRNLGHGAHQKNLSATLLKSMMIPCPPLAEQQEVVNLLRAVDDKIAAEENRKQTLDVLFKTLLHNLMTGKVRVPDVDLAEIEEVV